MPFEQLPQLIEHMLRVYQDQRISADETFGKFANRHATPELKQLFDQRLK
jgi:hypothetical protein